MKYYYQWNWKSEKWDKIIYSAYPIKKTKISGNTSTTTNSTFPDIGD